MPSLQDTAGQERFSSLATAFFRGADAVILVYDVTDPASLPSLVKWWDEFRTRAPVQEGREMEFPVAVVGTAQS
jgi:Ras-related protein Rab-7A